MPVPKPRGKITSVWLDSLRPGRDNGEITIDPGTRGHGALVLRITGDRQRGKKTFYYRYFADGERRFELVGYFDPRGAREWREGELLHKGGRLTLAGAREGFLELSKLARAVGGLKAHFAEQEAKRTAERRRKEDEARVGTFDDLLNVYVEALRTAGKPSAQEIDDILDRNVRRSFRHLLSRRASEITPGHVQEILAKMVGRGVTRQVNVTRSYLHAAFAHAGGAHDFDPRRLAANRKAFRLASNPVALVPRVREFERIGERVLTAPELKFYAERVEKIENRVVRDMLRLHLMTGAQRPTQLLRASWGDYALEDAVLRLIDAKGRADAREHLVPLIPDAVDLLRELRELTGGLEWPFSIAGHAPLRIETVVHAVQDISNSLVGDGKKRGVEVKPFTLRDVRRTVETSLAELGVSREVRAHLLSHGRGDKIARTYDKHHYLPEKRRAVEAWWGFVTAARAEQKNVVSIKRQKKGAAR